MSEKKGITVRDLASHLLHLIENGEGEKIIKVSVTYDDCEHIQNLKRIGNYKEIDFITLRGGNLKEENEQLRKKLEQIYSFKGLNCRCVR